jgi:glycosyltransferase involved in cell wall biosynthesis
VRVLQVSAAHVYLTYPFVLSWSLLEAMACGCTLIASDTAPVREVLRNGQNGVLVDFFDDASIAQRTLSTLRRPGDTTPTRQSAIETVVRQCQRRGGLEALETVLHGNPSMGSNFRGKTCAAVSGSDDHTSESKELA